VALLLAILIAGLTALILAVVIFSYRQKRNPKGENLISATGIVDEPLAPTGSVLVHGELWSAQSITGLPVSSGSSVKVVSYQNGRLLVEEPDSSTP
jgi:membrane-bound serine protease (ClpP class)